MYGLLLGVLLPYSAGKWWYGTQRITKEKILLSSASNLFREYSDTMTDGDVVNALSGGREFDDVLRGSRADDGLGKVEQSISQPGEESATAAGLQSADHEKLSRFEGVRRKAAALLWAYLGRRQLDGGDLDDGSRPSILLAISF